VAGEAAQLTGRGKKETGMRLGDASLMILRKREKRLTKFHLTTPGRYPLKKENFEIAKFVSKRAITGEKGPVSKRRGSRSRLRGTRRMDLRSFDAV